jgi:hypothetical protein
MRRVALVAAPVGLTSSAGRHPVVVCVYCNSAGSRSELCTWSQTTIDLR